MPVQVLIVLLEDFLLVVRRQLLQQLRTQHSTHENVVCDVVLSLKIILITILKNLHSSGILFISLILFCVLNIGYILYLYYIGYILYCQEIFKKYFSSLRKNLSALLGADRDFNYFCFGNGYYKANAFQKSSSFTI